MAGDITAPDLGTDPADRKALEDVVEVWHLAAIYDLSVGEKRAHRVNVGGTTRILELCWSLPRLRRLQHVSTCYVSGRYEGEFTEDSLDEGQTLRNHYESTKFEAEMLVRKALADGLPVTIYRPGIIVGDSRTGETQKYDGPYFLATFLRRQLSVAVVRAVGAADRVKVCLFPRDFVIDAMDQLSVLEESVGRPSPSPTRTPDGPGARRHLRRASWQASGLGSAPAGSHPGRGRCGARDGAAARPAGRGAGLLRLPDDLLDHEHRGRSTYCLVRSRRSSTRPAGASARRLHARRPGGQGLRRGGRLLRRAQRVRLEDLAGKTLVTSSVSGDRLAELASRGVDMVLDATPQPFGVTVNAAALEAMMLSCVSGAGSLTNDDLLDMIISADLEPRVLHPNGPRRKSRFAFVIHPLSQKFFSNVEPPGTIAKLTPSLVMDVVEKAVAYAPPFVYSHVTGIKSPTGAEAEGWLISVGGTPKELMAHSPEFTYARLLMAAETAKKLGAQVMGLGAFTKVVGDAGVTVAKQAPLPITTGNSYSASGALWAAHEAMQQLGMAEVDDRGRIQGKAMVVGATGAIGLVCARLLALSSDELWLVSPESAKLLALKHEIQRDNPRAEIHAAATPGDHLTDMDLTVTATSGAGKRVLDIMDVKPGCVITDVARPLDLSPEDVAKRPDVLASSPARSSCRARSR